MRCITIALAAGIALAFAPAAHAQDTPPGYKFCGWKNFENGGWTYDAPDGAYLALYSRNLTCRRARHNYKRVKYPPPDYRPRKTGYRCRVLEERHEYLDARCRKIGRPKVAFRWRTGA